MGNALFPVFEVPKIITSSDKRDDKYRYSLSWDLEKGDFVLDGANKMQIATGRDAFQVWCYKIVNTERFSCLAYKNEIGTEIEEALKQPDHDATESCLERTISEALLVNPKTDYVRNFTFEWNGSSLHCQFTVKGKNMEEFLLHTTFKL